MKHLVLLTLLAAAPLAGCDQAKNAFAGGGSERGRYVGVGHYTPGQMWTQVAGAPPSNDAAAAKPSDDEQVIIVMDSLTGEIRQCGNLSGRCVALNPWGKAAPEAPLALLKHYEQLAAEAEPATR